MSTRSRIAVECIDGTFLSVYCHEHGHPEHQAALLAVHYADARKAHDLIQHGDRRQLARTPKEGHPYEDAALLSKPLKTPDVASLFDVCRQQWIDWLYVYNFSEGEWRVFAIDNDAFPHNGMRIDGAGALVPIKPAVVGQLEQALDIIRRLLPYAEAELDYLRSAEDKLSGDPAVQAQEVQTCAALCDEAEALLNATFPG